MRKLTILMIFFSFSVYGLEFFIRLPGQNDWEYSVIYETDKNYERGRYVNFKIKIFNIDRIEIFNIHDIGIDYENELISFSYFTRIGTLIYFHEFPILEYRITTDGNCENLSY